MSSLVLVPAQFVHGPSSVGIADAFGVRLGFALVLSTGAAAIFLKKSIRLLTEKRRRGAGMQMGT